VISTIPAGARLGRYEIQCLFGADGMGEGYQAQDTNSIAKIAYKVLRAGVAKRAI